MRKLSNLVKKFATVCCACVLLALIFSTNLVVHRKRQQQQQQQLETVISKDWPPPVEEVDIDSELNRDKIVDFKFKQDIGRGLKYFMPKYVFTDKQLEEYSNKLQLFKKSNQFSILSTTNYSIEPSEQRNVINCDSVNYKENFTTSTRTTKLIIVINSKAENGKRRELVRKTWLNSANLRTQICQLNWKSSLESNRISKIEYIFALGESNERIKLKVEREARENGDLLVFSKLQENYHNLTLKHLSIFAWLLLRGSRNTKSEEKDLIKTIVLKCDDDAQVELSQWIEIWLANEEEKKDSRRGERPFSVGGNSSSSSIVVDESKSVRNLQSRKNIINNNNNDDDDDESGGGQLFCAQFPRHTRVHRGHQWKWHLTLREWPFDTFPSYCSGLAYMTTSLTIVRRLYVAAHLLSWSSFSSSFEAKAAAVVARKQLSETNNNGDGRQAKSAEAEAAVPPPPPPPPLWIDDVYVTGVLLASLERKPQIVRLNERFCYSRKQWARRKRIGQPCLVAEISMN